MNARFGTYLIVLMLFSISSTQSFAQQIFRLPVNLEDSSLVSAAWVEASVTEYPSFLLERATAPEHDHGEEELMAIFAAAKEGNKERFMSYAASPGDSFAMASFDFYKIFFAKAVSPRVLFRLDLGPLYVYYLRVDKGLPLLTVGILNSAGRFVNAARYVNHPVVASMNSVLNVYATDRSIALKAASEEGRTNIPVYLLDDLDSTSLKVRYSFGRSAVYFDPLKPDDSLNSFPEKYKSLIDFYARSITLLQADKKKEYSLLLGSRSRERASKTFTTGNTDQYEQYKKYRLHYSKIVGIVDIGVAQILIYSHPGKELLRYYYDYVMKTRSGWQFVNSGYEFYLDDLLKRSDFSQQLSKP